MPMEYDLHLFYDPRCYLGRAIHMVMKDIRAYVTIKKIDLGKNEHKSEEYLKLNPRGVTPTVYDKPENLFNHSHAIALFCVNQYESVARSDKLMSFETRFRAKVDELLWFSLDFEHVIAEDYLNIWGVVLRGERPKFENRDKAMAIMSTLNDYRVYYESKFIITTYYTMPEVFMAFLCDQMDLMLEDMPEENPLNQFDGLKTWLNLMRKVPSFIMANKQACGGNRELANSYKKCLKDPEYRLPPFDNPDFPDGKRLKPEKTTL